MSTEPIKCGDRCLVVGGAFDEGSTNRGKTVTVAALRGEHSQYGRIWSCIGESLVTEYGGSGDRADFAAAWLQKLPPDVNNDADKLLLDQPNKIPEKMS